MHTHVLATRVLALASMLVLYSSPAAAQDKTPAEPWTVTIIPTVDPLPAGFCAAVQLSVTEAGGNDAPRNPAGFKIGLADFDMTVTSPDGQSVVGQPIDPSHWSACACQLAVPGTVATVTATYPAKALARRARAPGVDIVTSTTFETAAPKGPANPPGCGTTGSAIAEKGAPADAAPIGPAPPGRQALVGATPTGFRLLPSVPIIASLGWDRMPNAATYTLRRSGTGTPSVERAVAGGGAQDTIPDPRINYHYTLVVTYADGTSAPSPAVDFVSPPLVNPGGFTAKHQGEGAVDFAWRPVAGAVRYRLDGPGMPGTGFYTNDTSISFKSIPGGANSWKLTALYQGNYADYPGASIATAVVRILPEHSQPWLSKNNGPGSPDIFQAPKDRTTRCVETVPIGQLEDVFDVGRLRWLGVLRCNSGMIGLENFVGMKLPLWGPGESKAEDEAVYGNAVDLGVGRRAQCAQRLAPAPYGIVTYCYASAHGVVPGDSGFNDFNTITHPIWGIGPDFILAMVIVKDLTGTTFLVFLRNKFIYVDADGISAGGIPDPYGQLSQTVSLDTEGEKYVPQVCMSCHGGKYNTTTRKVDGASFLPLDPGLLAFATPGDQAGQEEHIRKINEMIQMSDRTSAVAAYIRGLYRNRWTIPGTKATPDYVPQGWTPQAGFYRTVVKPYCATCHLAAPSDVNFSSWDNFQGNAGRIKAAVCGAHTMPHGEVQYKSFWTKDTGPVYVPGLLATTLGFAGCQ